MANRILYDLKYPGTSNEEAVTKCPYGIKGKYPGKGNRLTLHYVGSAECTELCGHCEEVHDSTYPYCVVCNFEPGDETRIIY